MYFLHILAIISIILLATLLVYEFKRDLMMFQQNSYRPERYLKWLRASGDTTSYSRLIAIFILLLCMAGFEISRFALICVIFFSVYGVASLAKRKYKKPLVFTARIKRLSGAITFLCALIIAASVCVCAFGPLSQVNPLYATAVSMLFLYCVSHFIVLCAFYILQPVEKHINRKFYNQAKHTLESMPDLKIIGITGSYGKTSTKHYLHRILSEQYETLMTPGSFNTTLGVVRTINEYLKPYHQAFIVEMGAKQKGDIKEICELTRPPVGIITAVGPQHLETFKTIENVANTKFELVDSLPEYGTAVLNNDYQIIAERDVKGVNVIRYSCYTDNPNASYVAKDIKYNNDGTSFILQCPDGKEIQFHTQLLGEYNIANLTGAIAVAILLDVPIDSIKYSVSRIEPVEHRLSIRRIGNGLTILDDAFNSNPAGSSMAVKVLASMNTGRRIIITPGMIELGEKQDELNTELGRTIAREGIDYVAIVGQYNKDSLISGLVAEGFNAEYIFNFNTFLDANAWMVSFARPGDVVLIENDLPDTFK